MVRQTGSMVDKQAPRALRSVGLVAVTPLRAGRSRSLPGQAPTNAKGSLWEADPGSRLRAV